MSSEYRDLLAFPHARGFLVTGFVARLPMSMLGVGIILLVTGSGGTYTLAGALSGCLLLAQALTASTRGRFVDRWGCRRVVLPMVLAHTATLAGILACCLLHGPVVALLALGLAAGTTFPPIGALVRSRWTAVLASPDPDRRPALATALSLESVVDEVVYIIGPVLATTLATATFGAAGFVCAMACTLIGGGLYATWPGGETAIQRTHGRSRSVLRIGGMRVVAVSCVALGTVLGSVEVTVVAFTREHGSTLLAGPLVAAFSVGGLVAGVAYGTRTWRRGPAFRFIAAVCGLLVGTVPIMLSPNVAVLAISVTLAGLAVSPALIGAHELVQSLVPAGNMTEGYSWIQTTIGLGLGIGVSTAGAVTDAVTAHVAFLVAGAAALLTVALALPFHRVLDSGRAAVVEPVPSAEPARS